MTDEQWNPDFDLGELPTGRRLPSYTGNQGVLGTIKVLTEADAESLAVARRNWREIPDEDLDRLDHRNFRHQETGEEWVIPRGLTSLFDTTSAQAFTVRGGYIVPLRLAGSEEKGATMNYGEMTSRKA